MNVVYMVVQGVCVNVSWAQAVFLLPGAVVPGLLVPGLMVPGPPNQCNVTGFSAYGPRATCWRNI